MRDLSEEEIQNIMIEADSYKESLFRQARNVQPGGALVTEWSVRAYLPDGSYCGDGQPPNTVFTIEEKEDVK